MSAQSDVSSQAKLGLALDGPIFVRLADALGEWLIRRLPTETRIR